MGSSWVIMEIMMLLVEFGGPTCFFNIVRWNFVIVSISHRFCAWPKFDPTLCSCPLPKTHCLTLYLANFSEKKWNHHIGMRCNQIRSLVFSECILLMKSNNVLYYRSLLNHSFELGHNLRILVFLAPAFIPATLS